MSGRWQLVQEVLFARCSAEGTARRRCRASSGAALQMSVPQSVRLLRSQHGAGESSLRCGEPSASPCPGKALCPCWERSLADPCTRHSLEGTVLGPPSLPRPVHRPSILERGRSSSQALLMPQSWPYPTGVSAQFLLCLVGPGRVSSPSPVGNPAQGRWERAQVFCIDHSCLVPAGVWGELPGEG